MTTPKSPTDTFDFWPERDLLVMQRRCLLERRADHKFGRDARGAGQEPVPSPPPFLYAFDSVYRYTRGVNDLANSGLGYGELAREARLGPDASHGLQAENWWLRRTRTGWQRVRLGPIERVSVPPPLSSGKPSRVSVPPSNPLTTTSRE